MLWQLTLLAAIIYDENVDMFFSDSLMIVFNLLLSYGSVVASWKISLVLEWDTSIDIMSHIPTRRLMLLS